jgi:hypothetical protein
MMLEERRSAAHFLRTMTSVAPEVSTPLQAAADLYDRVADEGKYVWPWTFDMVQAKQFIADPAIRQDVARHVLAAGEIEAKAVEQLEKALATLAQ